MIDWHSHILPGMDDGSRDVAESLALLKMLREQGVRTVVATPHFYANDESVESFLKRRKESYERLMAQVPQDAPKILLGAEVRYYPGIGRMEELSRLCIEGSKVLLLEMTMSKWTQYSVRELIELAGTRDVQLVMAHIERYMSLQSDSVWEQLLENGVLMQVNTEFFTQFGSKHKAIRYLESGRVQLLGSDCHNTKSRPPLFDKAGKLICKKLGDEFISQLNEFGYSVLAKN
ncbi:MAG: capsular polysaccharide biosynthesis protein [Clostridia bacterium]|nr:capsular polysaccharide biosynthesis protein [Clostridia bacterium]MBQ8235872.1 capsular polysaccharide biosynthesis protein [Clostridia bacterium]MBQ8399299.1 capsular polysaccharide biosynthesis protein [Clostridia bacterium]